MKQKRYAMTCLWGLLILSTALAQSPTGSIKLSPPDMRGGRPLMATLKDRASTKTFADPSLAPDLLSNLLWAAFGVNRPDSGKRTAATAFNCQNIDIYVVSKEGAYRYDAKAHRLETVSVKDLRALAATQDYARVAALQLVYVADDKKVASGPPEKKAIYAAFHTGSISQNVYLFCASAGLGSVVRDGVDRSALRTALALHEHQHVVMAQTVGHVQR